MVIALDSVGTMRNNVHKTTLQSVTLTKMIPTFNMLLRNECLGQWLALITFIAWMVPVMSVIFLLGDVC